MTDLSHEAAAAREQGVPEEDIAAGLDELQPDTQGEEPLDAELGDAGQGDLPPEDEPAPNGDGPDDLRVSDHG